VHPPFIKPGYGPDISQFLLLLHEKIFSASFPRLITPLENTSFICTNVITVPAKFGLIWLSSFAED
jgi:hypothetical protein